MTEAEPITSPIDNIIAKTRQAIQPYVFQRLEARRPRQPGAKTATTITVTSGKGGVGKTSFVANLAIALTQAGRSVIILDADLGLANIDVVFGIRPRHNLTDVVHSAMTLEDILVPGPNGIRIIAGGSGMSELARLSEGLAQKLFSQLRFLEGMADYLLIDTGAGIGESVVSFCLAADRIIVVTNPEPTALADGYGIIKVISQSRPDAHVSVLVNRAETEQEAEFVRERLTSVAQEFLGFPLHYLGALPHDKNMHLAIRQQTPLLLFSPMSPAAKGIQAIVTEAFHEALPARPAEGVDGFLSRLAKLWGTEISR